jgi:catechol 2,3-dioxygenase-like lactoylglutathione lyase family enzyme
MARTRGLLHLNLNVADLARSVAFYREVFGLELAHEVYAYVRDPDGYAIELSTQAILRSRLATRQLAQ